MHHKQVYENPVLVVDGCGFGSVMMVSAGGVCCSACQVPRPEITAHPGRRECDC